MGASQNTRYGSRVRAHTRSIPHDPYPDPYPIVQSDPCPTIHTPNHDIPSFITMFLLCDPVPVPRLDGAAVMAAPWSVSLVTWWLFSSSAGASHSC